jgi:hypothetical protein
VDPDGHRRIPDSLLLGRYPKQLLRQAERRFIYGF